MKRLTNREIDLLSIGLNYNSNFEELLELLCSQAKEANWLREGLIELERSVMLRPHDMTAPEISERICELLGDE